MKTSELTGVALNWAVTQCLTGDADDYIVIDKYGLLWAGPEYGSDWSQGGALIEREKIAVIPTYEYGTTESGKDVNLFKGWKSYRTDKPYWMTVPVHYGPTPLVAAMRCFIASKLGDEVEIPEELK